MRPRRDFGIFVLVTFAAGGVFWLATDWWVYVDFPDGPAPKFRLAWYEQAVVSGLFGAVLGGVTVVGCRFCSLWVARR